jgi:hypothetical protein
MVKFKSGQRVILTDNNYHPTRHCPVWGTIEASVGTVLIVSHEGISIQWDNGVIAAHFPGSLTAHNEGPAEPNRSFLLEKKRRQ